MKFSMAKEEKTKQDITGNFITQNEVDQLLKIDDLINDDGKKEDKSLITEIKDAILNSGKLRLTGWISLRKKLSEIEELVPHIDLIIKLIKQQKQPS